MYVCGQVLRFVISDEVVEQVGPTLIHKKLRLNGKVAFTLGNKRIRRCITDVYVTSRIECSTQQSQTSIKSRHHYEPKVQKSTNSPTDTPRPRSPDTRLQQSKKQIQWYRAQIYISPLFLRSTFFLVPTRGATSCDLAQPSYSLPPKHTNPTVQKQNGTER